MSPASTRPEPAGWLALALMLAAAGSVAWWLTLREPLVPAPESLEAIPLELGPWRGQPLEVGATVESILNATYNVQREYRHPLGELVWLYLGYYGTTRGGTPEHTPRACYSAHGWAVAEEATLVRDPTTGREAREYVVEQDGEQRLVVFWYQSFRSGALLSTAALRVDHIVGQLTRGRGDGALVRLSTPIQGADRAGARSRLLGFAALLDPPLEARWPEERPAAAMRGGGS